VRLPESVVVPAGARTVEAEGIVEANAEDAAVELTAVSENTVSIQLTVRKRK
jgi:hypothetical protein